MKKLLIGVIVFIVPFLLGFSIFRKANDQGTLRSELFIEYVKSFDYDFDTTVRNLREIKELSESTFDTDGISSFEEFFTAFGNFFRMVAKGITLPFLIVYDIVTLLLSVISVFLKMLGLAI